MALGGGAGAATGAEILAAATWVGAALDGSDGREPAGNAAKLAGGRWTGPREPANGGALVDAFHTGQWKLDPPRAASGNSVLCRLADALSWEAERRSCARQARARARAVWERRAHAGSARQRSACVRRRG